MIILAADTSLACTGWAVGNSKTGRPLTWGSIETSPRDIQPDRYCQIIRKLEEIFVVHDCEVLVIEGLHFTRNMNTVKALSGLIGALRYHWFKTRGTDVMEFSPSEIRKAIGLKGNAKKPEVKQLMEKFGLKPTNFDESDAMAVWYAALNLIDLEGGK